MKKKLIYFVFALFVLPCMVLLASCGKSVDFKINFIVDDIIYETIETEGNTTISMPSDPEKEGYTFDGWFWDKDVWSKPFTANSLLDAPLKKDMNVYAKFTFIHNHEMQHVDAVSPTCTENGNVEHFHCLSCLKNFSDELGQNEIENVVLSKMGHVKSSYVELTPATCTEKGIKQISCTTCHEVLNTREISATGHRSSGWTVVSPATCTEKGSEQISCLDCHGILNTREIPAKGHKYGNWNIEKKATYYEEGTKRRDCLNCEHFETESIQKVVANIIAPTNVRVEFGVIKWDGYSPFGFEVVVNGTICVVKVKEQEETSENENNSENTSNGDSYVIYIPNYNLSCNFARSSVDNDEEIQMLDANELEVELKSEGYNEVKVASINVDGSRSEYAVLKEFVVNAPITNLHFVDDGKNVTFTWDSPSDLYDYTFIVGNTEKTVDKAKKSYTIARESLEKGSVVSVYVQGIESDKFYPSKKNTITLGQLDAPVLSIDKLNISWESIANADNYKVKALTTETISNTYYSYDGASAGEHTITVTAFGVDYLNNSSILTFKKLVRPEISVENNIITWKAVAGQLRYATLINNVETEFDIKSYKITNLDENYDIYFYASPVQENSMMSDRVIISKFICGEYSTFYCGTQIGDVKTYSYPELTNTLYVPIELEDCDFSNINKNVKLIARKVPSSLDKSLVTEIIVLDCTTQITQNAFVGCSNAVSVTIPESITSIGSNAFQACSSLTEVYITNINKWVSIYFNGSLANPLYYAKNLYLNGELVTDVILTSATKIPSYAFIGCFSLTSVTISESVTSIDSYAFEGCSSLKTVTFAESSKCESIGSFAFRGCSSLVEMTLPFVGGSASATSASKSTLFGYIFGTMGYGYTGVTATKQYYTSSFCEYYYIPSSLRKVTILGGRFLYGAFYGCSMLTDITMPKNVKGIGSNAFYNCTSLTSVTIPESVTSIGDCAFYNCAGLTGVDITDLDKWVSIYFNGSLANPLYYAKNLYLNGELVTDVILTSATKISSYVFYKYTLLTSISISESVTDIGSYAFEGCSSLTNITILEGVEIVDYRAFYNCVSLTHVYYGGSESDWSNVNVDSYNTCLTNATIYYFSEEEPTEDGNYWHFVDGVVTEWGKD